MIKQVGNLSVSTPGERDIVMSRTFQAPRTLVFDALTKPELLRRWFHGPPGWELVVCEFEPRQGGRYRYVWRGADGAEMGMGGTIQEFVAPERIVSTEKFDQAWYPGEAIGTILLTEHSGSTLLTMTVVYQSREARDAVLQTPMAEGVAAGYDSLEQFLREHVSAAQ
jgi:uncharacterized protein YndB with AHSA1/START domain